MSTDSTYVPSYPQHSASANTQFGSNVSNGIIIIYSDLQNVFFENLLIVDFLIVTMTL
jgi:glutamate synthase domain-containing protein 3